MRRLLPLALLLIPAAAHADTRLVAQVAPDGADAPRTVTLEVRGDQARRTSSDGTVVLLDRASRKVWVMDTTTRTYWSASLADYLAGDLLPENLRERLSLHAGARLDPVKPDAPDARPAPQGLAATSTQFSFSGTASLEPRAMAPVGGGGFPRGGGGFPGGGRRGGGGGFPGGGGGRYPGGGGGGGQGGGRMPQMPETRAAGVVWAAPLGALTDIPEKAAADLLALLTEEALPAESPLRHAWNDQLRRRKLLPLSTTLSTTRSDAPRGEAPPPLHFQVTGIEKGLTLDGAEFRIPEGYTEVPRPARANGPF